MFFIPARVGAADLGQRETRRVHAKLVEHVDRIDSVHLGLRHDLALAVENRPRDEDVGKWLFANELQSCHHHARHPKKDDVAGSHQN